MEIGTRLGFISFVSYSSGPQGSLHDI
jgi:hypothetical protein